MGAVGLPEYDNAPPDQRPEKGLLGIRKALKVYANLRPVRSYKSLLDSSPLKNHLADGVDMIIVRELTSGLYYKPPRHFRLRAGRAGGQYHGLHPGRNSARGSICFCPGHETETKTRQRGQIERSRSLSSFGGRSSLRFPKIILK